MMGFLRRSGIDRRFFRGILLLVLIFPIGWTIALLLTPMGEGQTNQKIGMLLLTIAVSLIIILAFAAMGLPFAIATWMILFNIFRMMRLSPRQCAILSGVGLCLAGTLPVSLRGNATLGLVLAVPLALLSVIYTTLAYRGATWEEFA